MELCDPDSIATLSNALAADPATLQTDISKIPQCSCATAGDIATLGTTLNTNLTSIENDIAKIPTCNCATPDAVEGLVTDVGALPTIA